MATISLCMIVKNEEAILDRCLSSVEGIVDEIIIVDTGSTDGTVDLAQKYTKQVYHFDWIDDFSAARNFSFGLATMDYILWLDADDIIAAPNHSKLLDLKHQLSADVDSILMDYELAHDEYGQVTTKLKRNRIVKRAKGFIWRGAVHEYLEVHGNIMQSDVAVMHKSTKTHKSTRNLRIYEQQKLRGASFTARDLYYYANELREHGKFGDAIDYYQRFLQTKEGWLEDVIWACSHLAECYRGLNMEEEELGALLHSMHYDRPRPEICCQIGFYFLKRNQPSRASFWYEIALQPELKPNTWGLSNPACHTWLPHLQLCVCYDRLGEYDRAYRHSELAREYRPDDERMLHNKRYLESVLQKQVFAKN
ncbi:glycosyltransferase family 2 protein [Paenibacillus silviterrae]|uniref:glycosyltransferase family 2 protein n=1 Tax=Paenibacillus silviterrae TaxID=3242194 RepID=UPI002543DB64|nr:glycosyltransferase family 2 protein [Paenibacillus chinjuensis]